ncbi:MAG TPA: phosphoribosylglycinamide formyltransferase, partial [Syntrophomonadaceae bacterium]|nr:phosphoribosylglycinamide formyltransferase [Syntrophomonadaceae bacterium]
MRQIMSPGRLHLAILASGRGSNFEAILRACQQGELDGQIEVLISDQPDAAVLEKAEKAGVPALLIRPADYTSREAYEAELVRLLEEHGV